MITGTWENAEVETSINQEAELAAIQEGMVAQRQGV
jgi:hypothetical protein